jgi:hypothetical protein
MAIGVRETSCTGENSHRSNSRSELAPLARSEVALSRQADALASIGPMEVRARHRRGLLVGEGGRPPRSNLLITQPFREPDADQDACSDSPAASGSSAGQVG